MSVQQVRLELDSNVRRVDNGTALLGGSPFRLVRLSAAGSGLLDQWLANEPTSSSSESQELRRRLVRAGMVHPVVSTSDAAPSAGFVIPVFEDAAGLNELLRAVRREFTAEPIVVVDDSSSTAASVEVAAIAASHGTELIRHETNQGPAAARNTGRQRIVHRSDAQTRRPDVLVFLDADVVPLAGALRLMLAHFGDPDVAVVAPRVVAQPHVGVLASYEADNSALDMGPDAALVFPGTRVSYVPSAALAIRSSVLEEAGGFETSLRFGEDVDLVWRLIDDGHVVRYEPAAVVEHRTRASVAAFARQRFSYGSSAASLAERHGSKAAPLQLPANVVATTLAVLFGTNTLRFIGLISAAGSVLPLAKKLRGKVDAPEAEAARLTALAHGYAVQGLAAAATRSWAPLLLVLPRLRRALGLALVVPALIDWLRSRPANDPATHVALRALDHGAYCTGVWAGALRSRSIGALLPSVRFAERSND